MSHLRRKSASLSLTCTVVAVAVTLGGCTIATEQGGASEDVAQVSSQVVETVAQYHDNFNTIDMVIARCDWVGPSANPQAFCNVPAGYVIVGGGAEIQGANGQSLGNPGAMLTKSYPLVSSTTDGFFLARSKDHVYSFPHKLRAYVIGMRIKTSSGTWLPASQLRTQLYMVSASTNSTTGNTAATALLTSSPNYQQNDILVGGGAEVSYPLTSAGQLLYGSHPFGNPIPSGWVGYAKDHQIASDGTITAWAIGMRACPAGTNRCFRSRTFSLGTSAASTYQTGYSHTGILGDDQNWPLASIGGFSGWSGAGRLLTHMIPGANDAIGLFGGAEIWSKDHGFFDNSGDLNAYAVRIQCAGGPTPCSI